MSRKRLPINIFLYHDYRIFLRDLFDRWRKDHYRFTFYTFSLKAGFSAPNMLKLVIEGKRPLTKTSIQKIVAAFDFNKSEALYFENLVCMNQAVTHEEKNFFYTRMGKARRYILLRKDEVALYDYYSKWYYPVIRELVTAVDFRDDPAWIAKKIRPSISIAEAVKALADLERIGQIKKEEGKWVQQTPLSTTGLEVQSLAVTNFHKSMIDLAKESLDKVGHERRNISSLTMAISIETYAEIVRELQSMQQKIIDLAAKESSPRYIYQLNFQMFPVTNSAEEEDL
jgi:uncharacterized protein (TIGR02147 family)